MRVALESFLDDEDDIDLREPEQKFNLRKPIKPYLCSTPGDFNEEKDFLVKNIFPEINELCHLRGGHFFPVDIRWDLTGDEAATGQLLRLNLDYICKCSPFFICLLGESYGPYRELDSPALPSKFRTVDSEAEWIDKNYLHAALAGYTWVLQETHQNTSLTELEIIQAAFLNDNKHCHFYFRQPEHLDVKFGHLPETDRLRLSAVHLPENEYSDLSIRDLKQRIVKKALPVKYFRTFEELGKYVLKDWKDVIDTVYPPMDHPLSVLESEEYREWMSNEVFAENRRQVFVRSPEIASIMDELTKFANSTLDDVIFEQEEKGVERPYSITNILRKKKPVEALYKSLLLIHGDRGSGKSSIVANWLHRFLIENSEIKVISHFVGCSGRSMDISIFLRRCIKELREEYLRPDCTVEAPRITEEDQPWSFQECCEAFVAALSLGPTLIVLDGLDELGGTLGMTMRQIKEFKWLPFPLPPQCRIICTTCRSDLSFHSLSARSDTKLVTVPSFNTEKLRTEFLEDIMQQHFQHLTQEHYQLVTDIKLATKPLFLSILATEMQSYSVYTDLTEYLDEIYEKISSLRDLCVKSFQRWTKDLSWTKESLYGEVEEEDHLELEGWIPDTLRFLAVSRTGLTHHEMFTLMKSIGYKNLREVKNFDWLQFRTCIGNLVYEQPSGLIEYSHQHLKEVVEYVLLRGATKKDAFHRRKQYNTNSLKPGNTEVITASSEEKEWKEQKKKFHHNLAKYFLQQTYSQRLLEELPWHLLMSGDFNTLIMVLTDPVMIEGFLDESKNNPSNKLDLAYYWSVIKTADGRDAASVYEKLLTDLDIIEAPENKDGEEEEAQSVDNESTVSEMLSGNVQIARKSSSDSKSLVIPTIITSPPSRIGELSAVLEESLNSDNDTDQTVQDKEMSETEGKTEADAKPEGSGPQTTAIEDEEETDTDKDIDTKDGQDRNDVDTIFLTETKSDSSMRSKGKDLKGICNPVSLAWMLSQFLSDIGFPDSTQRILLALCNKLVKSYPLEHVDMLTHAKVQEELGKFSQKSGDMEQTEKWFRKSLRTVMDLSELDDDSPYYIEMQNLKGRLLCHHGYLRMNEGLTESAEDLLKEALECAVECGNLTAKATILYNLGLLRMQQQDFVMAESSLRQSLTIREQWFGRSHPLVADVLFSIASIVGNPSNHRGFNKIAAEMVYRRVLKIREDCQGKDHLSVAEVLFELGKLLKDSDHSALCEAVELLRRALDIRTTQLGGEHIDTRAVRQYLNNLEISLKMGRYEFGPAKRTETRTLERPYSNLSWREKDLVNFERKAKSRQSRMTGSILSRPSSYKDEFYGQTMSRHSSMSHVSASEKLMMETERPRLLHRENLLHRKLKPSPPASETIQLPRKQVTVEINVGGNEADRINNMETRVADPQIDSFGTEIPETEPSSSVVEVKKTQFAENPESCPVKLFKRYNSAGSSRSAMSQQNERSFIRGSSARSYGSSRITGFSYVSRSTLRSSQSRRSVTGPHAVTLGNTHSVTSGPNCTIESLLGPPQSPRDVHRNIHHKSAWYHVPGRYSTPEKPVPPKRSQKTKEAKMLADRLVPPHKTYVNTFHKKTPKNTNSPVQPIPMQYIPSSEFGMTVKGIGPVLSNGYYSNNPNDYAMNGYDVNEEAVDHHVGSTVKFKEAVFVE